MTWYQPNPQNEIKQEIIEGAKKAIIAQRAKSPVNVEALPVLYDRMMEYCETQVARDKPVTFAGMALAMGISTKTLTKFLNGDLDYIIEEYRICHDIPEGVDHWINENGEEIQLFLPGDLFQKGMDILQDRLESNCYQLKGNQVGSIFGLKAKFGWQDEPTQSTTNNTLVIADSEQAKKAMAMLTNG